MGFIRRLLFVYGTFCLKNICANYFQQFEEQILSEKSRQASLNLGDDFLAKGVDNPKEIDIFCPGNPIVSIKDLVTDAASAFEGGECMVINMKGENFSFRLSLNCEEAKRSEFNFKDGEL
jgi:hypothetical protein